VILGVPYIVPIYFIYGQRFSRMGLLVAAEGWARSDVRLRRALLHWQVFGIVHAKHEWTEMYVDGASCYHVRGHHHVGTSVATLAFSFVSLAAFGSFSPG
jgi:hypothetical protein